MQYVLQVLNLIKVSTLLDTTSLDVEAYKKKIMQVSSDMNVSTDELCESIYQAISASVDQADAIEFTTKAMKLAKGGFTDTATAVDIMTTAINAYGMSASDILMVMFLSVNLHPQWMLHLEI